MNKPRIVIISHENILRFFEPIIDSFEFIIKEPSKSSRVNLTSLDPISIIINLDEISANPRSSSFSFNCLSHKCLKIFFSKDKNALDIDFSGHKYDFILDEAKMNEADLKIILLELQLFSERRNNRIFLEEKNSLEQRLGYQKSFLKSILDYMPNPVYYKDKNGFFIDCNQYFRVFFGLEDGEMSFMTEEDILNTPITNEFERENE